MRISNLFKKVLLIVVMVTLSMSVDAQYNRRGSNNTNSNGTSIVEDAANGVVNGVKGLFSKKDKSSDKDKKDKKKDKKQDKKKDKKGNDDLISELSMSSKTEPMADDDIEVIASGDGTTKEQATLSALRSALEQAYGTFVSSNTQILNDELVKDEIVSITTGNVKHFDYLSESEINGKNFVTLKAIVSIGHLVSYAKSKGSSVELAGATFAANVRLNRFKYDNIIKAINDMTDQAFIILPNCFDFKIEGDMEPKQNRKGTYDVEFDVLIYFNSNAQYIQEIIGQAEQLRNRFRELDFSKIGNYEPTALKSYSLRDLLPKILSQFKIVDNLNELYFTDEIKEIKFNGRNGMAYVIDAKATPDNKNKTGGADVSNIFCTKDGRTGKLATRYNGEWEAICIAADVSHEYTEEWYNNVMFIYDKIYPSKPFMKIPVKFTYTLEELEKITGIDLVVL